MNDAAYVYEVLARRGVPPEHPLSLSFALKLAKDLAHRAAGSVLYVKDADLHLFWGSQSVFEPYAKMMFIEAHPLVSADVQNGKRVEVALLVEDVPSEVPPLRAQTSEDNERLRDFLDLSSCPYVDISDLRVLAPTQDPAEAADWILPILGDLGVSVQNGQISWDRDTSPVVPDLTIDAIGGNCPVQAEGTVQGERFYYRARGTQQSFETDDGFRMDEPVIGNAFAAGWISQKDAESFIFRAARAYARAGLNPC